MKTKVNYGSNLSNYLNITASYKYHVRSFNHISIWFDKSWKAQLFQFYYRTVDSFFLLFYCYILTLGFSISVNASEIDIKNKLSVTSLKLPISFEENYGQIDKRFNFFSHGENYRLLVKSDEVLLSLAANEISQLNEQRKHQSSLSKKRDSNVKKTLVGIKLIGAKANRSGIGLQKLPGKTNYFIGNNKDKWKKNIPTFSKIKYESVYSGIDLIYYGNQNKLEYDFIVKPKANPNCIHLKFSGIDNLEIDELGNLVLHTSAGKVLQHKPIIYQESKGKKQIIKGSYKLGKENDVGFQIASYDTTKPLVIDPILSYSTFLGGSTASSSGQDIAVDVEGNIYIIGNTRATDFPTAMPYQSDYAGNGDVFITKFNSTGDTLLFSTYLGGSSSDYQDNDVGESIAVDDSRNIYISGNTPSADFPLINPIQSTKQGTIDSRDAFVAKFDSDGILIYSTYLGGQKSEYFTDIAIDNSDNIYLSGYTLSSDFPIKNAYQSVYSGQIDVFLTKINSEGTALIYSTYLGGKSRDEASGGIAVDDSENVYLAGYTTSTDFPTKNAIQSYSGSSDTFVTKINSDGTTLLYSTFLGGSSYDEAQSLEIDSNGSAYVTGVTNSSDFPMKNPIQSTLGGGASDVFVTKINSDGTSLVYSTYIGGNSDEWPFGIAVDNLGNAYIGGTTSSSDFPAINALQENLTNTDPYSRDAFITKINSSGSEFIYSSTFGGTDQEDILSVTVDDYGNAYVTGQTRSSDFPTVNPFQSELGVGGGNFAAFVAKIGNDTDGDGLPDFYEDENGLDKNDSSDSLNDNDNDGLTNLEEFEHGTDPLNEDTDNDGFLDGDEVDTGTNPLDENDFPDIIPEIDEIKGSTCSDKAITIISGTNFGNTEGTVTFGNNIMEIISWSDAEVKINIPPVMVGKWGVVVSNISSSSTPFEYTIENLLGDDDGDGLLNGWERAGIDRNCDGDTLDDEDLVLPNYGANYRHKDIFVYVEWLKTTADIINHSHDPRIYPLGEEQPLDKVIKIFANAPVYDNPDGESGINLVIEYGQGIEETADLEILGKIKEDKCSANDYDWKDEFDTIKKNHFGEKYEKAFHFALFAHDLPNDCNRATSTIGLSRNDTSSSTAFHEGASDFIIAITKFKQLAIDISGIKIPLENIINGNFMHELGHNLGLGHGGIMYRINEISGEIEKDINDEPIIDADNFNNKPNHLSIMNYLFTNSGLRIKDGIFFKTGHLDYSRFSPDDLIDLDEKNLNEITGLVKPNSSKTDGLLEYGSYHYCGIRINDIYGWKSWSTINDLTDGINWNCKDGIDFSPTSKDINNDKIYSNLNTSLNEWENLAFTGGSIGALSEVELPATTSISAMGELSIEEIKDLGLFYIEPLPVEIDIKPYSSQNKINLSSEGVIPVAILTTNYFDASDVDQTSLILSGALAKQKGKSGSYGSFEDVDSDGDLDLIVHFYTSDLNITENDTNLILEGLTKNGFSLKASDNVTVVEN